MGFVLCAPSHGFSLVRCETNDVESMYGTPMGWVWTIAGGCPEAASLNRSSLANRPFRSSKGKGRSGKEGRFFFFFSCSVRKHVRD